MIFQIPSLVSKNLLQTLLFTVFAGTTVATSASAGMKLMNTFSSANEQDKPLEISNDNVSVENSEVNETNEDTQEADTDVSDNNEIDFPTAKPTVQVSANNLINTTNTTGCIITLSGKQYDITRFISTHSGGNVFQCGTDMTDVFTKKHGTNFGMIHKYLVSNSQQNGQTNGSVSASQNYREYDKDDEEDDKEWDRLIDKNDFKDSKLDDNENEND